MQNRPLFFALGATLLIAQAVSAQESGDQKFYADIGYARLGPDLPDSIKDSTYTHAGITGRVGYNLSKHWSIEGEAMVGVENDTTVSRDLDETSSTTIFAKSEIKHLLGVYAKGTLPVTSKLNAFARVGVASLEVDFSTDFRVLDIATDETTTVSFDSTDTQTGLAFGAGLSYDITDKLYLRGDFTQYDVSDVEVDSLSLGVGFRF
ncbi:MAG: porin family protein [Pseudomonadota bacterium]